MLRPEGVRRRAPLPLAVFRERGVTALKGSRSSREAQNQGACVLDLRNLGVVED